MKTMTSEKVHTPKWNKYLILKIIILIPGARVVSAWLPLLQIACVQTYLWDVSRGICMNEVLN